MKGVRNATDIAFEGKANLEPLFSNLAKSLKD